jgi:hypothetical protein
MTPTEQIIIEELIKIAKNEGHLQEKLEQYTLQIATLKRTNEELLRKLDAHKNIDT